MTVRDLERDLQIAEAISRELKPYLLSDALYWQLSGGSYRSPFPKGTLGGLMFRLHLLSAIEDQLDSSQQMRLYETQERTEIELQRWGVQAEEKATREVKARLSTWRAFLHDARDALPENTTELAVQIENRVIVDLLMGFLRDSDALSANRSQINKLDAELGMVTVEGDFVWDEHLFDAFPPDRFPYLYREPRGLT